MKQVSEAAENFLIISFWVVGFLILGILSKKEEADWQRESRLVTAVVTKVRTGTDGFFLSPSSVWYYTATTALGECHGEKHNEVKIGDQMVVTLFRGECSGERR